MHKHTNSVLTAWVKNVYSLCTQTGTTSDDLYTPSVQSQQLTHQTVDNSRVTPLFVQVFTSRLSTQKNHYFNLLYNHLYPLSTAPINMKKKEIRERNTRSTIWN